jgi:hypothetical protein
MPVTLALKNIPYKDGNSDCVYIYLCDEDGFPNSEPYIYTTTGTSKTVSCKRPNEKAVFTTKSAVVDYYVKKTKATQYEITPDTFAGNFYLEAETLFRNTDGVDLPATFIIPNCKVQSNFTFNMASSGDPSTFTFTLDAFPDYTRFDSTKKVLSII